MTTITASNSPVEKVRISIRVKLLFFVTALIAFSLIFYLFLALKLVSQDKTAYIYEAALSTATGLSAQIEGKLNLAHNEAEYIANQLANPSANKEALFAENSELVQLSILNGSKVEITSQNLPTAQSNGINPEDIPQPDSAKLDYSSGVFREIVLPSGVVLYEVSRKVAGGKVLVASLLGNEFTKIFQTTSGFETLLISAVGETLSESSGEKSSITELIKSDSFRRVLSDARPEGVLTIADNFNLEHLLGYYKIRGFPLYVVTSISKESAFTVMTEIQNKSYLVAISVLCFALFISILLARSFAKPLEKLASAAVEIGKGNFGKQLDIKTSDEIGQLTGSFNYMSKRIVNLMEEEKEKTRLEKELEVAKIVQESFFPPNEVLTNHLKMSAYYQPSDKCGGDWWSFIEQAKQTILLLGDATGHGVGSALVTATAASSCKSLELRGIQDSFEIVSPEKVLETMNYSILSTANRAVMMTFFVAIYDHESHTVRYASASHNPPLLLRFNDKKEAFKAVPLIKGKGPILGREDEPVFQSDTFQLEPGDCFFLYTDCVVEAVNDKDRQYGLKKLCKLLEKHGAESTEFLRDIVYKDLIEFCGTTEMDDDLTFLAVRRVENS